MDLILFGDIIITQKERKFKQQKKHSEECWKEEKLIPYIVFIIAQYDKKHNMWGERKRNERYKTKRLVLDRK